VLPKVSFLTLKFKVYSIPSLIFNDFVVKNFWVPTVLFNFIESNKNVWLNEVTKLLDDVSQYSL
jgi:hypothetical protein